MGTLSGNEFKDAALLLVEAWNEFPRWRWNSIDGRPAPDSVGGYLSLENVPTAAAAAAHRNAAVEDGAPESDAYHFYTYHVVFNESYRVPSLFFNAWTIDGTGLDLDEVQQDMPDSSGELIKKHKWTFLTREEHPYLKRPWFTLHPCGTGDAMRTISTSGAAEHSRFHYLVAWISLCGEAAGLKLDSATFTSVWNFKDDEVESQLLEPEEPKDENPLPGREGDASAVV